MARTLLAGERTTTQAPRVAVHLKLEVQNGSGTWKNLGALVGDDYVVGGTINESIDSPVGSASFTIRRQTGTQSLAPLIFASALNVDDTGAYAPLLDIGRAVRASTATLLPGVAAVSGDYREVFVGRIDKLSDDSDPLTITCSDLGAWLMQTQIEVDAVEYGSEPTGIAMETVIQNIVNAWPSGKGLPTLVKQSANTFMVTKWTQGRTKVLSAIRDLALQSTGEDVRFRYDATHVSRLTLFDPDRSRATVDATFGPTEYRAVPRSEIAIDDIRNVGLVPYVDASGVLHTASASDAVSIADYGRIYFELPASDSITTAPEATALIGKVVNDLAGSPLEYAIETSYVWFVQLYDRHTVLANGAQFDQDQTLGVVGYQHTFDQGAAFTTISYKDRIVGAYADWLRGIAAFANLAPSLDVVATPGPTSYSIAYSASGGPVLLSINGGAYAAAPASPISVARPSAGSDPLEYSFAVTADDQTVSDSVTIPPLGGATTDTDTVTPDLVVTPGTVTATTQQYTASATNPKTAASVPVLVKVKGTTATDSLGGTYADGAAYATMAAGATLTVQRSAFATVAGATVTLRAEITGGGAETIQRTILPQVKTTFGPSLDVVATPGAPNYSIAYVGSGGTVELSINGGAYSTAPASPISVARPGAGGTPLDYTFRIVADGQTITDSVTIQPVDKDSVVPDVNVVLIAQTATYVDYTVTAVPPNGESVNGPVVLLIGTTGTDVSLGVAIADGVAHTAPTGAQIRVNRPAFGTTAQASAAFSANIPSAGSTYERIIRSVMNQVKTSFGPSLVVTTTPGSLSYSIAWSTANGATVELSINGGTYASPPTSPITVSRTSSNQSYDFRATLDGQVMTATAPVPALPVSGGNMPSIDFINPHNIFYPGDGGGSVDISWTTVNMSIGTTYDLTYKITNGTVYAGQSGSVSGITSPYTLNVPMGPAYPSGRFVIQAILDGVVVATGVFQDGLLNP